MSIFVQAQGIKTVHAGGAGGGVKKCQNSVHVVVKCPHKHTHKDLRVWRFFKLWTSSVNPFKTELKYVEL